MPYQPAQFNHRHGLYHRHLLRQNLPLRLLFAPLTAALVPLARDLYDRIHSCRLPRCHPSLLLRL